jgi:hypothetical protein
MCLETFNLSLIAETILCRHEQQFSIVVCTGIVGRYLSGLHVLSHWVTGNNYRDFFLHDLPKPLKDVSVAVRNVILSMPIMANGEVQENPLHGLHTHQIWILWIFTYGYAKNPLCMQLLLTTKRHFTITLWMPVRQPATTPASLNRCSSPWKNMSIWALNIMDDMLSNYKCGAHSSIVGWGTMLQAGR